VNGISGCKWPGFSTAAFLAKNPAVVITKLPMRFSLERKLLMFVVTDTPPPCSVFGEGSVQREDLRGGEGALLVGFRCSGHGC